MATRHGKPADQQNRFTNRVARSQKILSSQQVVEIHEFVIDAHELQGMAGDKSIEAIIARIDNRIAYGMILN